MRELESAAAVAFVVALLVASAILAHPRRSAWSPVRSRVAVCFLATLPCPPLLDFADVLEPHYDIFVCVDDECWTSDDPRVIQIPGRVAKKAGYWGSLLWQKQRACSRDKALYYFCEQRPLDYDHVWMIEEDVFVPRAEALLNLDAAHPDADLLSAEHVLKPVGSFEGWHWPLVARTARIGEPFANSMICAARLSRGLLRAVASYAQCYGQLFLDEALFNTLAMHARLKVSTPRELSTIVYQKDWQLQDLTLENLYHPVKDCYQQVFFRRSLYQNKQCEDATMTGRCYWKNEGTIPPRRGLLPTSALSKESIPK